jgi:hypothetical protein
MNRTESGFTAQRHGRRCTYLSYMHILSSEDVANLPGNPVLFGALWPGIHLRGCDSRCHRRSICNRGWLTFGRRYELRENTSIIQPQILPLRMLLDLLGDPTLLGTLWPGIRWQRSASRLYTHAYIYSSIGGGKRGRDYGHGECAIVWMSVVDRWVDSRSHV